jgi:hypothetical protein
MSHRAWAISFLLIIALCVLDFWFYDFHYFKFLMIKGDEFIEYLAFWR